MDGSKVGRKFKQVSHTNPVISSKAQVTAATKKTATKQDNSACPGLNFKNDQFSIFEWVQS